MGSGKGLSKLQMRNAGRGNLHTTFNIFTRDGQNRTGVKSPRPMTIEEAQIYFNALSIGADD